MHHYRFALYLSSHFNPKIIYPLSCELLALEKYTAIKIIYINSDFYDSIFNRTWSLILRYGLHNYSSIQLKDIEVETMVKKINELRYI